MTKNIAVLPGDGIGPEIMEVTLEVLDVVAERHGLKFNYQHGLIGGAAYEWHGEHFPEVTREICKNADAVLFGSVGGPVEEQNEGKWKDCEKNSILGLRKAFNFNANFRPAKVYPALDISPLKPEITSRGIDLLIVRELLGDIYFGEHKFYKEANERAALDTATYTEGQIRSVVITGFQAAKARRKKLTSVDKANVLHTSKLWREIVEDVAGDFPEVQWEHLLVDNCAMQLVTNPDRFDVIVTANLFGDILSDLAAVIPGSLGLTPSASLSASGFGMYEPSGGSAPDIAGKGIANPTAMILSAAMMLKYSFGLNEAASHIEQAVEKCISAKQVTGDISATSPALSTKEFAALVAKNLRDVN